MDIIIISISISGGLFILFEIFDKPVLKYVFKPLTTVLAISLTILLTGDKLTDYSLLILTGLVFSLVGDIFLMLPSNEFVKGLASFLVARIFFTVSFVIGFGPYYEILILLPIIIIAMVFLFKVLPKTNKLKIPVLLYSLVLVIFLWQATGRFYYLGDTSALFTFIGAVLFVFSDSVLGYARFARNSIFSVITIHVTYWGALVFIALSV